MLMEIELDSLTLELVFTRPQLVDAGQYAECRTPKNNQTYCCVMSSTPVTMAGYALGRDGEPGGSEDFDPSMYYIYQLL